MATTMKEPEMIDLKKESSSTCKKSRDDRPQEGVV